MSKLEFSINLPSSPANLIKLALDFEQLPSYLPDQLKSVKILEKKDNETTTEETMVFSSIFKKKIVQKTVHKLVSENQINTKIIDGPAKGTTISVRYEKENDGTKVNVTIELKVSLTVRILKPKIEKFYKIFLTGILYKMNTKIMENTQ